MSTDREPGLPGGNPDERELLLLWLGYLRGTVLRKIEGLSEDAARWTPGGKLISLLGIVNHLTHVEWRWIDGGMRGETVSRSEEGFSPGPALPVNAAVAAYREREVATEAIVRSLPSLAERCRFGEGTNLR